MFFFYEDHRRVCEPKVVLMMEFRKVPDEKVIDELLDVSLDRFVNISKQDPCRKKKKRKELLFLRNSKTFCFSWCLCLSKNTYRGQSHRGTILLTYLDEIHVGLGRISDVRNPVLTRSLQKQRFSYLSTLLTARPRPTKFEIKILTA